MAKVEGSEGWQRRVQGAVAQALSEPGSMPTKWLLVAEFVEQDGQYSIGFVTSEQLSAWDSLGMLEYALLRERVLQEEDIRGEEE